MTPTRRIAVLGAGYVGSAFARAATDAGHRVCAVRRSPASSDDGIEWVPGDVTSGAVDGLPAELDAVVLTIAPSRADNGYERTYPPAAAFAVELAKRTGARSLLYTSSTGVYGGRDGSWVTETSSRHGTGPSNAALAAAEDLVLASTAEAVTVMRIAGIYGPGRDPRGRFSNAAELAQRGAYWVNLAHRDDIVAAALLLLDTAAPPRVVNVSDGTPTQAAEIARWLAAGRGIDPANTVVRKRRCACPQRPAGEQWDLARARLCAALSQLSRGLLGRSVARPRGNVAGPDADATVSRLQVAW